MLSRNQSTPIAIFFGALTVAWLRILLTFEPDCRSYWIGYLGFGILLELCFMTIHFLLKSALFSRQTVARTSTRIVAALVALPLSLITVMLCVLILQSLIVTEDTGYLVDMAIVLITLALPTLLILRHSFGSCRKSAGCDLEEIEVEDKRV